MTWLEFFALIGALVNVGISVALKKERVVSIGLLIIVICSVVVCEGWV